jgi:hypothetical protein
MKTTIIDFIKQNQGTNITKRSLGKMENTIKNLSNWETDNSNRNENIKISDDKLYTITNFYKEFISNFVNVFPNIILNEVNYDNSNIPKYYGFSMNHSLKLKKNIVGYYEKLKSFYGKQTLANVLNEIQKSSKNITRIANATPKFSSIHIEEDKTIKPVFDERTSRFLFEYYLLRVLINYIDLSDEKEMFVTNITKQHEESTLSSLEYLEDIETRSEIGPSFNNNTNVALIKGNKSELKQRTAELLIAFIDILNIQKNTLDVSYEIVQDRVFKLREREKDMVTDRLKNMTTELRDVDTILKINKLGMYSVGMQKGLTMYDKDYYENEEELRNEMSKAEKKIRETNPDSNDGNIDLLVGDYMEEQDNARGIEDDAYGSYDPYGSDDNDGYDNDEYDNDE